MRPNTTPEQDRIIQALYKLEPTFMEATGDVVKTWMLRTAIINAIKGENK